MWFWLQFIQKLLNVEKNYVGQFCLTFCTLPKTADTKTYVNDNEVRNIYSFTKCFAKNNENINLVLTNINKTEKFSKKIHDILFLLKIDITIWYFCLKGDNDKL